MSRIVQNGIVYSSGNDFIELVSTLPAGETSLIFENAVIKACTTIDVYPHIYTAQPTNEVVTDKLTLTFDPQQEDMEVRVRLSDWE